MCLGGMFVDERAKLQYINVKNRQDIEFFKQRCKWSLSRLPLKSVPLLVRLAFGCGRHRPSSHHRSTFHFPFPSVLSLSYTPGFNPPITCLLFNPLFLHVCLWVIVCMLYGPLCGLASLYCICLFWVNYFYLLISAVLRLTPLPTDHITTIGWTSLQLYGLYCHLRQIKAT